MQATLPEKYYLDHALELFGHVQSVCAELLEPEHQSYLEQFNRLSEDAQCLLIRLLARKPRYFPLAQLEYSEITSPTGAINELLERGFVGHLKEDDWPSFCAIQTKSQLLRHLQDVGLKVKTTTSKADLVALATSSISSKDNIPRHFRDAWLAQRQNSVSDYILFLYFGDTQNRLQKFAMRDLGVLKTRQSSNNRVPRYASLAEARHTYRLHQLGRDYARAPEETREQTIDYLMEQPDLGGASTKVRNKLILAIGQDVYKHSPDRAIELWRQSSDPKALEKWVRAAYQRLGKDEFKAKLVSLKQKPHPAESKVFLEDFYQRKYCGKRTSIYTDMLRENSAEVCLDESYLGDVEEGVISHYRQQGQQCWFTENKLWHVLFAFTCWPILYGREQEQYSDFDHFPAILKNPDFYEIHQQVLEQRLEMLRNRPQAMAEFTRLAATHYGMPTGLFNWSPSVVELLRPCLDYAPEGALEKVMRAMSRDYRNAASGYPDIMALKKGALRFEEVKAPGDSLRPNQLLSIERLRQAGFTVDICQVTWAINPDQVYAVVDIETTGGRRSGNSITEIAVVRIRDGEIISRWSTLINPGRSIPSHITRLTGINNQMVADAPRFVDIVDELDQQLADAIFVAHNVGFDYGFIKSAYETIGRKFKKPKLCTVQQSRKAFPGLRSYSLANLTAAFDIDLKNAHRALSDATATAHLLRLIQQSD